MSTHGCFATPFPPSFFFLVVATRWWSPGARCHFDDCYYPEVAYYYVKTADDQE